MAEDLRLTDTQRKILEALCRPCTGSSHFAPPATNQEIADELFLSVDAIKAHLRVLYKKFGVEPLAHNQKRARLVELALEGGVITGGDTVTTGEAVAPTGPGTAVEEAGHTAVAVPAESPAAAEAPLHVARGVPRVRGSSMLIAAGLVLGTVAIVVIAIALLTGGDGGSGPAPTPEAYIADVSLSCTQALAQGDPSTKATREKRAVAYSQAFEFVADTVDSSEPPAGDNPGLTQFTRGVNDAADLNRQVAQVPEDAGATDLASVSADLTIAAGNIQAGAISFELGPRCSELGTSVAGKSAQNAAGPP